MTKKKKWLSVKSYGPGDCANRVSMRWQAPRDSAAGVYPIAVAGSFGERLAAGGFDGWRGEVVVQEDGCSPVKEGCARQMLAWARLLAAETAANR